MKLNNVEFLIYDLTDEEVQYISSLGILYTVYTVRYKVQKPWTLLMNWAKGGGGAKATCFDLKF